MKDDDFLALELDMKRKIAQNKLKAKQRLGQRISKPFKESTEMCKESLVNKNTFKSVKS